MNSPDPPPGASLEGDRRSGGDRVYSKNMAISIPTSYIPKIQSYAEKNFRRDFTIEDVVAITDEDEKEKEKVRVLQVSMPDEIRRTPVVFVRSSEPAFIDCSVLNFVNNESDEETTLTQMLEEVMDRDDQSEFFSSEPAFIEIKGSSEDTLVPCSSLSCVPEVFGSNEGGVKDDLTGVHGDRDEVNPDVLDGNHEVLCLTPSKSNGMINHEEGLSDSRDSRARTRETELS